MIRDNFIIGYGPDNIINRFPQYKTLAYSKISKESLQSRAHNDFLDTFATQGILGIFSYILLLTLFFRKTYSALKEKLQDEKIILTTVLSFSIISYLIHSQFNFPTLSTFFLFYLFLGMTAIIIDKKNPISFSTSKKTNFILFSIFIIFSLIFLKNTFSEFFADIYYRRGINFSNKANINRAITNFEKAVSLWEREIYYINLAYSYEKKVRWRENVEDGKKAERYYLKAIALKKDNPYYYNTLGNFYLYLSNIYSKNFLNYALKMQEEALKRDSFNSKFYIDLAKCYIALKNLKSAEKILIKAKNIDKENPEIYINLGNLYYNQNKLEEAISNFKKAFSLEGNLNEILINLGSCYLKKGDIDTAIEVYKEVFDFNPENGMAHYNLGIAYYLKGDYNNALKEFKEAISLDPNLLMLDSLYYKAEIYYSMKLYYKAKEELEKIFKINKNYQKAKELMEKIKEQRDIYQSHN